MNPLVHYLAIGRDEGRAIYVAAGTLADISNNSFDREYYLLANPDVGAAGLDPLLTSTRPVFAKAATQMLSSTRTPT
jgi:hypothetical protein